MPSWAQKKSLEELLPLYFTRDQLCSHSPCQYSSSDDDALLAVSTPRWKRSLIVGTQRHQAQRGAVYAWLCPKHCGAFLRAN